MTFANSLSFLRANSQEHNSIFYNLREVTRLLKLISEQLLSILPNLYKLTGREGRMNRIISIKSNKISKGTIQRTLQVTKEWGWTNQCTQVIKDQLLWTKVNSSQSYLTPKVLFLVLGYLPLSFLRAKISKDRNLPKNRTPLISLYQVWTREETETILLI